MRQTEAQGFLNQIPEISHDLPIPPALLRSLFVKTRPDALVSLQEIARDLSRDQGLTAKVLSVANSAYYGLQSKVSTIERGVSVLGLRELRTILLGTALRLLAGRVPAELLKLQDYLDHNFHVALKACELGRMAGHPRPDELFTAGLLHDLGVLIVALYHPGHFREIGTLARERSLPPAAAETSYWGIDHGIVGALVIKSWDLPLSISEPVSWHHCPGLAPEFTREAAIVALADALEHIRLASPWTAALDLPQLADLAGLEVSRLPLSGEHPPNPFLAA
jgi:HD-like signal output (HDOD) protein